MNNESQLTKNKMDLSNQKVTNHPASSEYNNKHNSLVFHKIWKKYNEIQLTKNKMILNNQKMKKSSTLTRKKGISHK